MKPALKDKANAAALTDESKRLSKAEKKRLKKDIEKQVAEESKKGPAASTASNQTKSFLPASKAAKKTDE